MFDSKLIINADDFGYNSNINAAIVSCFQKSLINSTTIMVNMEGFEEAVKLADKYGFKDKIGIHLNLTEGKSLTNLSGTSLVDEKGYYIMKSAFNPRLLFSSKSKKKIKAEIRAQYNKLLSFGIEPTHIDSHQHVHTFPWLVPIFLEFAKEVNLKLRITSFVKRKNFFITIYHTFLNMYYKKKNVHFTDKFGNVNYLMEYLHKKRNLNPVFEIMVHPDYKENLIIDTWYKKGLEERLINLKELYNMKILNTQ